MAILPFYIASGIDLRSIRVFRLFTFFMLTIGLGVVAVPTGLIASALTNNNKDRSR